MNARTSLWASLAIAASIGLAGCGGSNNTPRGTMEKEMTHEVDLPDGHGLGIGDLENLKKGEDVEIKNEDGSTTTIACGSDDGCVLTVAKNPVTGLYSGTSTGGQVTVTVAEGPKQPEPQVPPTAEALPLPSGHNLNAPTDGTPDSFTIEAGEERDIGNVKFECMGSADCTVTVRNLLGKPDAHATGDVSATLIAATDSGGATTPTPGVGGTGTGSNEFLSRAMLLEAVSRTETTMISADEGIGSAFSVASGNGPDALSGGYLGIVFERGTPASDDRVHIRSDIRNGGTPAAFSSLYGNLDKKTANEVSSSDTDHFWNLVQPPENGSIGGDASATSQTITTARYVQGKEVPARFGLGSSPITGNLICKSGDCLVTNTAGVRSSTGTWVFKATTPGADVTPPDDDYLVFGFWKQTPKGNLNARPVVLEAFYAGSDPFEADNVVGLSGSATYNGNAVGRYASRAAAATTTTRGDFTATVALSVEFGNDSSQTGTVRGGLSGFADPGDTDIPAAFSSGITLPLANISGTGTFSGGKPAGYTGGSWSGQFFGNGSNTDDKPTSAAGKFEGWSGTPSGTGAYTSVEGAFGTAINVNTN